MTELIIFVLFVCFLYTAEVFQEMAVSGGLVEHPNVDDGRPLEPVPEQGEGVRPRSCLFSRDEKTLSLLTITIRDEGFVVDDGEAPDETVRKSLDEIKELLETPKGVVDRHQFTAWAEPLYAISKKENNPFGGSCRFFVNVKFSLEDRRWATYYYFLLGDYFFTLNSVEVRNFFRADPPPDPKSTG